MYLRPCFIVFMWLRVISSSSPSSSCVFEATSSLKKQLSKPSFHTTSLLDYGEKPGENNMNGASFIHVCLFTIRFAADYWFTIYKYPDYLIVGPISTTLDLANIFIQALYSCDCQVM